VWLAVLCAWVAVCGGRVYVQVGWPRVARAEGTWCGRRAMCGRLATSAAQVACGRRREGISAMQGISPPPPPKRTHNAYRDPASESPCDLSWATLGNQLWGLRRKLGEHRWGQQPLHPPPPPALPQTHTWKSAWGFATRLGKRLCGWAPRAPLKAFAPSVEVAGESGPPSASLGVSGPTGGNPPCGYRALPPETSYGGFCPLWGASSGISDSLAQRVGYLGPRRISPVGFEPLGNYLGRLGPPAPGTR